MNKSGEPRILLMCTEVLLWVKDSGEYLSGRDRFIRFLQCFENQIGSVGQKIDSVQ